MSIARQRIGGRASLQAAQQQQQYEEQATTNNNNNNNSNIKTAIITAETTTTTTTTANIIDGIASANATTTATTIVNNTAQQQQQQQTYLPQTSLLKIEPFVPSFNNNRLRRRPIGRSYSTLSSTVIHKRNSATTSTTTLQKQQQQKTELIVGSTLDAGSVTATQLKRNYAAQLRQQRLQPNGNAARTRAGVSLIRQRSKSTSSSATSNSCRPATTAALNSAGVTGGEAADATSTPPTTAIVTPQPNGICRITRQAKEREELPDRINYDRRGLTAVPIFEQEQHLRLLSLQHNLINIFHIPMDNPLQQHVANKTIVATTNTATTQQEDQLNLINSNHYNYQHHQQHAHSNGSQPRMRLNSRLSRQQFFSNQQHHQRSSVSLVSPKSQSPTQHDLYAAPHPLAINGGAGGHGGGHKLIKRHSLLQKHHYHFNNAQLPPAPATPSPTGRLQYRYGMLEKSKSFVSNYTRHLHTLKQQHNLKQHRAELLASKHESKLKSFDSNASCLTDNTTSTLCTSMTNTTTTTTTSIGSEIGEEDYLQEQLAIKNKQLSLSASYGNIFQHLVFLDLYDNQIERISNLDGLTTLTVLLLGKNRISDISGLASLRKTLRVLDLHGNKITSISNKINCLQELKSLNLAGNQIRQINANDFNGLNCLKELNLKRNKIKRINGFQHLVSLERLWLCHNDLHKVEDMASIAKADKLLEVTIENNPVSLAGDCVSFLVSHLPLLQTLSQMPITEQVRRAALSWRQHKEHAEAQSGLATTDVFNSIRREEVISNARTNWELLRSQQTVQQTLRRSPKKLMNSELAKISEGNEIGANAGATEGSAVETVSIYAELQALIKLPPIEQQQQHQPQLRKDDEDDTEAVSDDTSLGPNVDSCSSSYSTDNEADCERNANGNAKRNSETVRKTQQEHAKDKNERTEAESNSTHSPKTTNTTTLSLPAAQTVERPSSSRTRGARNNNNNNTQATTTAAAMNNGNATSTSSSNSSTLSLATLNLNNSSKATLTPTTATPTMTMPALTTTTTSGACKRSLMRAQTLAASSSNSSSNSSKASANKMQQNLNQGSNSGATTSTTANVVAIVAPMGTPTTTRATTLTPNGTTATSATLACSTSQTASSLTVTKPTAAEREREQGGDYLIEICGRYLNIYGQGALRFIDKQWNPAKANDVHTLNFSYINFNNITNVLARIKVRFPHAEHFVFRETNINCLGQLNALAELQGITTLHIDGEGNSLTTKPLWRSYAIYRLSHWGLKQLNGTEVVDAEIEAANTLYAGLSDLVLWSMPDVMLQPLLARLRLDETCTASKLTPKEWLMRADNKSLRLVVGKEALQWKKANALNGNSQQTGICADASGGGSGGSPALSIRERGRMHFASMLENTCDAVEKLHKLETLWPSMLSDIVRNTLLDYAQLDVYVRNLMCELMK